MLPFVFSLLTVVAGASSAPELDLATALGRARAAPGRLAVDAELAAAAQQLAMTRGARFGAPSLVVEAGPRHGPDREDLDLAVGADVALGTDRAEHRAARTAYAEARRDLGAAADLEARLDLEVAFVDAWEAQEALVLAERDLEAAEEWRATVAARVAAGAEAPYETTLVSGEVQAAQAALAAARARRQRTTADLAARLDHDADGWFGLAEPRAPTGGDDAPFAKSLLVRAVRARAELQQALIALETARAESRWSLAATLAREGEERVARVGLGYRWPLVEAATARRVARDAEHAVIRRVSELALAQLAGRLAAAREQAAGLAVSVPFSSADVEQAMAALGARVAAGKDRPSQVLPLRRQLLAALQTDLATRAARLRAAFEIAALTTESSP